MNESLVMSDDDEVIELSHPLAIDTEKERNSSEKRGSDSPSSPFDDGGDYRGVKRSGKGSIFGGKSTSHT